ncbi:PTS system N-acetylgalactosamine-specific transporter subunit IIB [Moellerella wisconsensis]|nr:PTS system N-acetylgalactosamine-specific transporter subunit IIB [Moellerella wisconsensis]
MANIVLVRIDERLLHGQIRITWGKFSGANTIIVANDDIAANPLLQAPFKGAAGGEYTVLFRSIDQLINSINKADERRRILILCKNPTDVARLVNGGVTFKEVNVGNMHHNSERTQVDKNVSLSPNDIEAFKSIQNNGIESYIQHMPESSKKNIFEYI